MDPFALFDIPLGYDLDLGALERRHRELVRVVHPDRFAGAGAVERRRALSRAVDVNEAWRALRDPVRRAEVLLRRLGVATGEGAEPKAPPHLLMEMMEQREALAAAHAAGDGAALGRLEAWAREREAGVLAALSAAFARALAARAEGPGAGASAAPEAGGARAAGDEGPPGDGGAAGGAALARGEAGATAGAAPARGEGEAIVGALGELRYLRRFLDEVRAVGEDFAARAAEGPRG